MSLSEAGRILDFSQYSLTLELLSQLNLQTHVPTFFFRPPPPLCWGFPPLGGWWGRSQRSRQARARTIRSVPITPASA